MRDFQSGEDPARTGRRRRLLEVLVPDDYDEDLAIILNIE
jgi:hypothetical protein